MRFAPQLVLLLASTAWSMQAAADTPGVYKINPLNVPESCVYFAGSRITDHRVEPPVTYYEYSPSMRPCNQVGTYSNITVTSLAGGPWNGSNGYVTLRILGMNSCLTNPAVYGTGGVDSGKLLWQTCKDQSAGGVDALRQSFFITTNGHGASQIASHMQYTLGVPNAQPECVERATPQTVLRRPCQGLANWMFRKPNAYGQ
jgi:hypothetical protein